MDFEQSEQTRQLVVVTALQALSKIYMNRELLPKIAECEKELRNYAFLQEIELWFVKIVKPKCWDILLTHLYFGVRHVRGLTNDL